MDKNKKRVLKEFPDAKITLDSNGGYIVVSDDKFLAEDFFMPDTQDADKAWEYAAVACKTTQCFNRTHPMRMDLKDIESKLDRLNRRKRRGRRK